MYRCRAFYVGEIGRSRLLEEITNSFGMNVICRNVQGCLAIYVLFVGVSTMPNKNLNDSGMSKFGGDVERS